MNLSKEKLSANIQTGFLQFRGVASLKESAKKWNNLPEQKRLDYVFGPCESSEIILSSVISHSQTSSDSLSSEFQTVEEFLAQVEGKAIPDFMLCPFCADPTIFENLDDLKTHVAKHKSAFSQICDECQMDHSSSDELVNHEVREHLFPCSFCFLIFATVEDFEAHRSICESKRPSSCDIQDVPKDSCSRVETVVTTAANSFTCHDCQLNLDSKAKLKYHRLKTHGKWKNGFKCPECSKSYRSSSNLKRHLKFAHKSSAVNSELKMCPHCQYTTNDKYHLTVHLRKHSGERPFICQKCTFGFYKKSDLMQHESKCRGVKHTCKHCGQNFHFKKQLQEHMLWSTSCGRVRQDEDHWPLKTEAGKRYLSNIPSMIRINLSRDKSVVGVNCENLIDDKVFVKKTKKASCGICTACEQEFDCGTCTSCSKGLKCDQRKCTNRIFHYGIKKSKQVDFLSEEPLAIDSTSIRFELETFAANDQI